MPEKTDIEKAEEARNNCGEIFENQVKDDVYDNGLLDMITTATKDLEKLIQKLKAREA